MGKIEFILPKNEFEKQIMDYKKEFEINGYSVRKSERRKGYAKEVLRLALEKCNDIGISKVLITCDKNNIAPAKTIIYNNGILENEVLEKDGITQKYWINVS